MRRNEDEEQQEQDRLTRNLAALAFTLSLVVASLFLVERLAAESKLEDCLLQGRTNCAPIDLGRAER